jgi:hypothetical protein
MRILAAAFLIALTASSAFAAQAPKTVYRSPAAQHDPYLGYNPHDPTVVAVDGAYVGRDPDPNIRGELRRFPGPYVTGGF